MRKIKTDLIIWLVSFFISGVAILWIAEYQTRTLQDGIFNFIPFQGDSLWFDHYYLWNNAGSFFALTFFLFFWAAPRFNIKHEVSIILKQPFWWMVWSVFAIGGGFLLTVIVSTDWFKEMPDSGTWIFLIYSLLNPIIFYCVPSFFASPSPVKYVPPFTKQLRKW